MQRSSFVHVMNGEDNRSSSAVKKHCVLGGPIDHCDGHRQRKTSSSDGDNRTASLTAAAAEAWFASVHYSSHPSLFTLVSSAPLS